MFPNSPDVLPSSELETHVLAAAVGAAEQGLESLFPSLSLRSLVLGKQDAKEAPCHLLVPKLPELSSVAFPAGVWATHQGAF